MLQDLSTAEAALLAAFLALFGTLTAAAFGIVTSFINNWFGDTQAKRRELTESERQTRELAVRLALEKWKLENEADKERLLAKNEERTRDGMAPKTYIPAPIEPIVVEMWKLTAALKPKEKTEQAEFPVRSGKDWLCWPLARLRNWWESR